jgi:serine/threonine protein kinase
VIDRRRVVFHMPNTLDHFEILEPLGDGAGSRIWHIRDRQTAAHYAMKVVVKHTADDQKYLDQAKHEYDIAQRFDHPSLLRIYDMRVLRRWFREREVRTLLEYVCGQTIESLGARDVSLLVLVFARVADAVAHMHRRDVFHADLKPNNILVSQAGDVKVIDFGLAWLRGQPKFRVQGTPGYLAPEQVHERIVTEKTDIFNLGATLHRLLSPKPSGRGNVVTAHGFVFGSLESSNPEVPRDLSDLIARCCESKPSRRPEHMSAVRDALREIADQLGVGDDDLARLLHHSHRTTRRV